MLTKIATAMGLATWLATAVLLDDALAESPTQDPSQQASIQSALIKLEEDKDAFERYVSEQLSPQMSKIISTFEQNADRAGQLLAQLRNDPNNMRLRAQYEDALSSAIAQASAILDEFSHQQEPAFQAIDSMSKTLHDASRACDADVNSGNKVAGEFHQQADAVRSKLTALAKKYEHKIRAGQPLPDDVDLDSCLLQTDLETAQANEKISRTKTVNMQRLDFLLPVAAEVAIDEVIGEDVDAVGRHGGGRNVCAQRNSEKEDKLRFHRFNFFRH